MKTLVPRITQTSKAQTFCDNYIDHIKNNDLMKQICFSRKAGWIAPHMEITASRFSEKIPYDASKFKNNDTQRTCTSLALYQNNVDGLRSSGHNLTKAIFFAQDSMDVFDLEHHDELMIKIDNVIKYTLALTQKDQLIPEETPKEIKICFVHDAYTLCGKVGIDLGDRNYVYFADDMKKEFIKAITSSANNTSSLNHAYDGPVNAFANYVKNHIMRGGKLRYILRLYSIDPVCHGIEQVRRCQGEFARMIDPKAKLEIEELQETLELPDRDK